MQLSITAPATLSGQNLLSRREAEPAGAAGATAEALRPDAADGACSFQVDWARSATEIGEAQRLRFRVFSGEMGAELQAGGESSAKRDVDAFDAFFDHLLVRATTGAQQGEVIATCRVMSPDGAQRAGGFYTDTEFDLAALSDRLPLALEMGRVCIDPAWRNGLVVMGLWRELGRRMSELRLDTLIGCASVSLNDGGAAAVGLWQLLKHTHLVAPMWRVRPRKPFDLRFAGAQSAAQVPMQVPALIKAYLRCGGKLLGPPALDTAFNTADFPMWMHLSDLPSRYGKRIFGACA